MIDEKVREKKPFFQEFVTNFKTIPESQLMRTSVHYVVVLIL